MAILFKGFKQIVEPASGLTSLDNGYIYLVRTNDAKTEGYIYFNGKKYGNVSELRTELEAKITELKGENNEEFKIVSAALVDLDNRLDAVESDITELSGQTHTHTNKTVLDGITEDKVNAWDQAATEKHTHDNKELLDSYTQTEGDLADAVAKKHEHTNKTVLDGITAEDVAAWDAAEQNAKDYADGLAGNYDEAGAAASALTEAKAYADQVVSSATTRISEVESDITELEGRVETAEGEIDALQEKAHTHANADVLSGITAEKVAAWDNKVDQEVGKGLSTNDFTNDLKTKLEGIESGAEVNVIETVKVNGTALTVTDKAVDIEIPAATVTGVTSTTVNGLKLELTDNKVTLVDDGLASTLTGKNITLTTAATPTEGYLKTYVLTQGTTEIGKIDLPKELVVTGGEVITATTETGLTEGEKYLKLTIANQDTPVYIAVKDLVDAYTAGNGIAISETNEVSVRINNGESGVKLSADTNGLQALITIDGDDVES